jgi:hypothetical protein
MNYADIKTFPERCEEHPNHQSGFVTARDVQCRLHEEVIELRLYIENGLAEGWIYEVEDT